MYIYGVTACAMGYGVGVVGEDVITLLISSKYFWALLILSLVVLGYVLTLQYGGDPKEYMRDIGFQLLFLATALLGVTLSR